MTGGDQPGAFHGRPFLSWDVPTVSIGHHQQAERAADTRYCAEHGIPVVRRPTGGRAVLHDCELTYAVVSNDRRLFPPGRLDQTYLVVARALQTGLGRFGFGRAGRRRQGDRAVIRGRGKSLLRLGVAARAARRGRKIAGSAQRRLKRSFLQHGSIPLNSIVV